MRPLGIAIGVLAAACPCVLALDSSVDVDQYAHNAWTVREGFFKGIVNAIAQTADGYLWFGTEFGLVRFDGVRTVPWQPATGEHLPRGVIRSLLCTRDGALWIGTDTGLARWKDRKLTEYQALAGEQVRTLLEDREGTVWVGGAAVPHARLCAIQSGTTRCYGNAGSLGHAVNALFQDKHGNLWVGADNGLWRWTPEPRQFYAIAGYVYDVIDGDNGALLIATPGGMRQLVAGKVKVYPVASTGAGRLLRDRDGNLWATVQQGVLHVHQGRVDVFEPSDDISGGKLTALFEDREGNIWVATANGVVRFRDFAAVTISAKQALFDYHHTASVLAASDGSVWVGALYGLYRWKQGRITVYSRKASSPEASWARKQLVNGEPVREIIDPGLPDDRVLSLMEDHRGRIWATAPRGVSYLENNRFVPLRGIPGGFIHSLAEDSAEDVWMTPDEGLVHLHGERVVEQIPWARVGRSDFGFALLPDPAHRALWLGFFHGGVTYFKDGQVRASYSGAQGLGDGRVNGFRLDREGVVWAATEGGLSRLKDGHIATLTADNGLPCNSVDSVVEDDDHSFWLNMACGIVRITRADLDSWVADSKRKIRTTVFDASDGVTSHAFYGGASPRVGKSGDGKLWFVSFDNGISVIDPRHLPFDKFPPPVHIEKITADGKTYCNSIENSCAHLRPLPPRVRDLVIDYTALSLVAPEKVHFKYKLEGQDQDWKEEINRREVQYSNLPPGRYQFRVTGSNSSGVWNETGDMLEFSIDAAYYQTNWFRASCAAALMGFLWLVYYMRVRKLAREFNLRLEGRVSERTRIARELHDTLLQGFQGLMLRLQLVDDLLPDGRAKHELEQTLERADQAIAEGRKAVYDLRSSATTSDDLALAIRALGNELSRPETTEFSLVVEGEVRDLHPIVRDELYRIGREAVRNAFTHGHAQRVEVEIAYTDRMLRLRIRDDGRGIAPQILKEGRAGHYGLPGMRERAAQIGAKLSVWTAAGVGTEIDLRLPGSVAYRKPPHRSHLNLHRKEMDEA